MTRLIAAALAALVFIATAQADTVIAPLTNPKAELIFLQADLREARAERAATTDPLRRMHLTWRIRDLKADIAALQARIDAK